MKAKRLLGTIRMMMCMGSKKRGALARKHHLFGMVGENVVFNHALSRYIRSSSLFTTT